MLVGARGARVRGVIKLNRARLRRSTWADWSLTDDCPISGLTPFRCWPATNLLERSYRVRDTIFALSIPDTALIVDVTEAGTMRESISISLRVRVQSQQ